MDEVWSQESRDKDILSGPFNSKDESHHRDHVCKCPPLVEWSGHYNSDSEGAIVFCFAVAFNKLICVSESMSVTHTMKPATNGEALMYFSALTSAVGIAEEE